MSSNPEVLASLGVQYITVRGLTYRESTDGQINVETCPLCKHDGWHFFLCYAGKKDGLWACHRCSKSGNLFHLQSLLGDKTTGVHSTKDWSSGASTKKIDALPDVDAAHAALLGDADAMDYLLNTRGFTQEIIEQQRIGLLEKHWFKSAGEVRALVIPYLVGDNCIFVKYRTLPPAPKDFNAPTGWDVPLFNGEILKPGLNEIIFLEGESDTLALMSQGISNVVGVPGASMKKAAWITELDDIAPERIYILFDNDKAGSKGAQELAARIGIDRCLKLVLPELKYTEDGVEKRCKDVNDFFAKCGGTVEQFEELKANAKQFDVTGVTSTGDALEELTLHLQGKDSLMPTYCTPWPSLNAKVGFENGDTIDVMADGKVGKTNLVLNMLEYAVATYNEPALLLCMEMPQIRLARRWVSHVTQTDDSAPKTPAEDKAKLAAMLVAVEKARNIAANREADLYFAYPMNVTTTDDVYKLIKQCIRRYGVKWVAVDNLQLLSEKTLTNDAQRTIHLSKISKALAGIAKDFNIKMIRIIQPHRIREGNMISASNADGSSQISKDCDCLITLHRTPIGDTKTATFDAAGILDTEASMDAKMQVTVALSRYSGGGGTTLYFDGAMSTIREYTAQGAAAIPTRDPSLIRSTEVVKPLFTLPNAPRTVAVAPEDAAEITI